MVLPNMESTGKISFSSKELIFLHTKPFQKVAGPAFVDVQHL